MWINVKDFADDPEDNAQGNGTHDDTDAIQLAITYAQASADPDKRNAVYFPPGTYRITETLEVYRNQGLRLIGVGNVQGSPPYLGGYATDETQRETAAVLFWDGEPGETLLRITGSYYGTLENLTLVGATPQKYFFDANSTSSGPSEGKIRFDDSTFANVTQVFANIANYYGVEVPDWLDGLDDGSAGRLTINEANSPNFAIFDVTGSVAGSGGSRTINVSPVQSSGTGVFSNDRLLVLSFRRSGGSPQRYRFRETLSGHPDAGELGFDSETFSDVAEVLVANENANGFDMSDWLDSVDGDDVRVTVQHPTNSTIRRIFKVNGVTDSGDCRTIAVTPLYQSGTISDNDPVVLICSKQRPIRDRAGALVVQQSETGWAAGHMLIQNCTFRDADEGVRLNEDEPRFNSDVNTFMHCAFLECGVGVMCNANQVLNNIFINCDFNDTTIGIDHSKGGAVRIYGASMSGYTGDLFLRIAEGGFNASSFLLHGVRLEMSAGKPSLLETTGNSQFDFVNALIDGFEWCGVYPDEWDDHADYYVGNEVFFEGAVYRSLTGTADPPNPNSGNPPLSSSSDWQWRGDWVRPVRLKQGTNCNIRGSLIKGPFASVTGNPGYATLLMDNCRFNYTDSDVVTTGTKGMFKLVDCTGALGNPLNDFGNWPADPKYSPKTGSIIAFGGSSAPDGYLMCDGAEVSRTTYADLFDAIGTTYGSTSGTTFKVPDLRQRFPLGKAASGTGSSLGGTGGAIDHTHVIEEYAADVAATLGGKAPEATAGHTHTMQGANPPFLVVNYIIKT